MWSVRGRSEGNRCTNVKIPIVFRWEEVFVKWTSLFLCFRWKIVKDTSETFARSVWTTKMVGSSRDKILPLGTNAAEKGGDKKVQSLGDDTQEGSVDRKSFYQRGWRKGWSRRSTLEKNSTQRVRMRMYRSCSATETKDPLWYSDWSMTFNGISSTT